MSGILPLGVLSMTLACAVVCDLRAHKIPNRLTLSVLALGLALNTSLEGGHGLLRSLEGIAVAGLSLLLYALRALGAGDVKLLGAVGALMGPTFMAWTLLGTALAGGALALAWAARRGVLAASTQNAVLGARVLQITRSAESLAATVQASKAGRMPYAPAIAIGAAFAACCLHGRTLP